MQVTILSTADWHAPLWTNKQHIARRLAERGHRVTYIESLGLRAPTIRLGDLLRIGRRFRKVPTVAESLQLVRPPVLPFHKLRIVQALNRVLMRRRFRRRGGGFRVLITFSPLTYGIEGEFDRVVYHSVDLLHEIEGVPSNLLLKSEINLLKHVDVVAASSRPIADHLKSQGAVEVKYWPNVGDVELFASFWGKRREAAVFAGHLTAGKVSLEWLHEIVQSGIELHLAGPVAIDGTDETQIRQLLNLPAVHYHGVLAQEDLAELLGKCTVGLIPYSCNNYTEGVFPMKVAEYLSAGLHVVSSDLPSLRAQEMAELSLLNSSTGFRQAVKENLPVPPRETLERRYQTAMEFSWERRLDQVELILDDTTSLDR